MALNLQDQARFNQLVQDGIRYARQLGDTLTESSLNQLPAAAAATNDQFRDLQIRVTGLAAIFAAFFLKYKFTFVFGIFKEI